MDKNETFTDIIDANRAYYDAVTECEELKEQLKNMQNFLKKIIEIVETTEEFDLESETDSIIELITETLTSREPLDLTLAMEETKKRDEALIKIYRIVEDQIAELEFELDS